MRRVLFLAYHFPPIGGGGVQRNAKFARYLPALGYEPVVVTGPGVVDDRWTPSDRTLNGQIGGTLEVHRLPGPEPPMSGGRRARAERWLGVEAPSARWWIDGAVETGRRVGADTDLIYCSLVPYETAEAVLRLADELRKPWVVDLQDPWALDEMWVYPSRVHRRRDLARMRECLARADAVVMNTPEAALRVEHRFPELRGRTVVSIPNGFDSSDFDRSAPARDDAVFRIVHTGTLHTDRGRRHRAGGAVKRLLGGAPLKVDILTRSHLYLLAAIDLLIAREPALAAQIEVHLAGVMSDADRQVALQSPVSRLHGYLPHAQTIELIRSADLLFLPMQDLEPGARAGLVPGKTYEYLAAERPILGAVPDGDARDLLLEAGTGLVCRPSDVEAMARIISTEMQRVRRGGPSPPPNADVLARYERRGLTRDLAGVFDAVLGGAAGAGGGGGGARGARNARAPRGRFARARQPGEATDRPSRPGGACHTGR
jgi:glycosyltransferase involved in cell wall biosynthesis